MNKKVLEQIKKDLLERKTKIESELSQFTTKDGEVEGNFRSGFPQYGDKEDENAEEIATYGDNLSIEYSLESTLRDIVSALKLIDEGKYGVCKYCGNKIDDKRLQARPVSSSCIDCKEKLSR